MVTVTATNQKAKTKPSLAAHEPFNSKNERYVQYPVHLNIHDVMEICNNLEYYQQPQNGKPPVVKPGIKYPVCITCGAPLHDQVYLTEEGTSVCSCFKCADPKLVIDGKDFVFRYGNS